MRVAQCRYSLNSGASEGTRSGAANGEYPPLSVSERPVLPVLATTPYGMFSAMSARAAWSSSALRHAESLTAERLGVEDPGQALLTLAGYPISPPQFAQE